MKPIIETDVFVTEVPLLEETDRVKGGLDGPANAQATVLASRTKFLNERRKENDTALKNLDDKVDTLTADDVNAETKGAVKLGVDAHVADADPHTQYLTDDRAKQMLVEKSTANKPNGYLQLDENGKLPAGVVKSLYARYIVVADDAERLALPKIDDLTIAAQNSNNRLYYLNGGLSPADDTNWTPGQSVTVNGVISIFGRTGIVEAQDGDYTADQITETLTRLFVTPQEKQSWNQKQAQLVSGINIKTFKGISLLGDGDLDFTPDALGAAAKVHAHTSKGITDFDDAVGGLLGTKIKPGSNLQIVYDSADKSITLNATAGTDASTDYAFIDRLGSAANQNHIINLENPNTYGLHAYALKLEKGLANQTFQIDTFDANSAALYDTTNWLLFDGSLKPASKKTVVPVVDGARFSVPLSIDFTTISASVNFTNLIPVMSSAAGVNGYVPFASADRINSYDAWRAFSNLSSSGASDCWASVDKIPTDADPQWIGIELPSATKITAYSFVQRFGGEIGSPAKWKLQGSNDKSVWDDVEDFRTSPDQTPGAEFSFPVYPTKAYKYYRMYITARNGPSSYQFVVLARFKVHTNDAVVFQGPTTDDLYTVSGPGLIKLADPTDDGIRKDGVFAFSDVPVSAFNDLGITKLVSPTKSNLTLRVTAPPQIAILKNPINAKIWSKIQKFVITASEANAGKIRYAITLNNREYYIYSAGAWSLIGELKADRTSAASLNTVGMSGAVLGGLSYDTLSTLMVSVGLQTITSINIAMSFSGFATTDVAKIDDLSLLVDNADSWKMQTPAEVEIRYNVGSILFKTVNAGDYRLLYRL